MKLESWPTPHIQHTKEAILTYGLGISNKSCVKSRREDCGKHCSIQKKFKKNQEQIAGKTIKTRKKISKTGVYIC